MAKNTQSGQNNTSQRREIGRVNLNNAQMEITYMQYTRPQRYK